MKNLLMMITVALMVLGVVYIVKHRKQSDEPLNTPAFNSGAPLENQPIGEFDGEYDLDTYTCNEKDAKEQKAPVAVSTHIKVRGMSAKISKKIGPCDVAQYLTLVPNQSVIKNPAIKSIQMKQNRMDCSPQCRCHPLVTGSVIGVFNIAKKEIQIMERVRSEKSICSGKLPVIFKYTASVNSSAH